MKIRMLYRLVSCLAIAALAGCGPAKKEQKESPASQIDYKLFFKNPEKASFQISKDGKYFSYRAGYKGKMNIFVQNVSDTTAVRVTNDTLRSISGYFWKGDRIV